MSKKVREDAINKKIEEIRKKNEEITKRFQEIEIDKKNAETLSQEATERMKNRFQDISPPSQNIKPLVETSVISENVSKVTDIPKNSRKIKKNFVVMLGITDYRPQRLTDDDLPPPDPVFSYLTDRLREGDFCTPISPSTHRKRSTSSQASEMSIGSSRGSNSRKASTASNSSWTSDTSSKCSGFSNYQPPRKHSACRNYFQSRRFSSVEVCTTEFQNGTPQQEQYKALHEETVQARTSLIQDWSCAQKGSVTTSDDLLKFNRCIENSVGTKDLTNLQKMRKARMLDESRCEYITNWRDRQHYANDGHKTGVVLGLNQDSGLIAIMTDQDLNNNNNSMNNQNLSLPIGNE